MAAQFHDLRWRSVALRRSHGAFFERDARGWYWRVVQDGNGNGLRTREVRRGIDRVLSGPHRLEDSVEHVRPGFPPGGRVPQIPPGRGWLGELDDPVKFGRSDLVSFSPLGDASSGTLYLTDGASTIYAVVLFGPTARVRVWRFDRHAGSWSL